MRMVANVFLVFLLFHCLVVHVITESSESTEDTDEHTSSIPKPEIYSFHVFSDIHYRYSYTTVRSKVLNPANVSQEITFTAVLPDSAFISGFQLLINNETLEAHVSEKEAAKREYSEAVSEGRTAGHVGLSSRDSERFTISVNVEPYQKVTFRLTYEELLERSLGMYQHIINIDPGQIVEDLSVRIRIKEASNITILKVPALRMSNEILEDPEDNSNPLAIIERPDSHNALVTFRPNPEQQRELASDGIRGHLIVKYDVDRSSHAGEMLMYDGYFVHYFSPEDLPPLRKHVTFVLDVSGSMSGRKIEQLKQAMSKILNDLHEGDLFSILVFSTTVQLWAHNLTQDQANQRIEKVGGERWGDYGEEEDQGEAVVPAVIASATEDNVTNAKYFINRLQAIGATNINDALLKALDISKLAQTLYNTNELGGEKPEPIIIFLTDGKANVGSSEPRVIILNVKRANTVNSTIFSLALGNEPDLPFLTKLSLKNSGFARKIYEASDTVLQLTDFYHQIASPLLANVTFKYQPDQVMRNTLTRRKFRRIYSGSELVVAGKTQADNVMVQVNGRTSSGHSNFSFTPVSVPTPVPSEEALPSNATNITASFMERLWAYLTIKQMLLKSEATDDGDDDSDEEYGWYDYGTDSSTPDDDSNPYSALDLALRYSFVTPLTSLVVVEPNRTTRVETVDASDAGQESHSSGPRSGPDPHRPNVGPPASGNREFLDPNVPVPQPGGIATLTDITWLSGDTVLLPVGVNGTNEELHIASANVTNTAHATCCIPSGEAGHCRHLRYCALHIFASDQAHFLPYFCRIDRYSLHLGPNFTSYVGVCCPDSLQPPAH